MVRLLVLMLAFVPLALAVACSSEDTQKAKEAVGTQVSGVLTPAGTQIAGAQTAVSGAVGTISSGAGTAVTGAATQVGGAASTVQAGAGTAVVGAATQVGGASGTVQAGVGTAVTGAATARAGAISLPIANAEAARDALLEAAKSGDWSKIGNAQDLANYPAWQQAANALKLAGAAAAADPNTVSVYRNPVDPSQPASATNPNLIAFAVDDASGKCAAGAMKGYPSFTSYQSVQIQGKPCTAQSVVDQVKASAGTPTP